MWFGDNLNIPNKTINELSELLRNNPNETQVNLPIGSGKHLKGGKMVDYIICIMLKEVEG